MADISVPKSDKGYNLAFTVQDATETAYNLTDYTIKLKVWNPSTPNKLILNGTVDIDVAASGTCHYTVVVGNFDVVGIYKFELELTKADVIESTRTYSIEVIESG